MGDVGVKLKPPVSVRGGTVFEFATAFRRIGIMIEHETNVLQELNAGGLIISYLT